jgi:hypothetical protein
VSGRAAGVSLLYRRWPWLARRKVRKAPETAYTGALRKARIGIGLNLGFMVLNIVTHNVFFIFVTIAFLCEASWHAWSLPRHPQSFLARRSALRQHVEHFERRWQAGTWTGAHPSESALLGLPFGVGVGLWHSLLLAPGSPPAESVAVGVVAGLALAFRHVVRKPRTDALEHPRSVGAPSLAAARQTRP